MKRYGAPFSPIHFGASRRATTRAGIDHRTSTIKRCTRGEMKPTNSLRRSHRLFASAAEFTGWKLDLLDALFADPRLPSAAKVVAYCILQHMNWKTGECFPTLEAISTKSCLNSRRVRRMIKILRRTGWLVVTRKNRRHANDYDFIEKKNGHRLKVFEGAPVSSREGAPVSPLHLNTTPRSKP